MPKPILIKCRQCGKQIERDTAIELRKGWYVCSDVCAEAWQAAHAPKPVQQSTPSPMRQLTNYVQSYAPNTAWVKFGANVQRMCKDGMTIAGIHYTLRYMREHEQVQMYGDGLALVPYYYDAARNYYQWQQRMKQQVAGWTPADEDAVIVRRDKEEDVFT